MSGVPWENHIAEWKLYCYKNVCELALGNQTPFRFRTLVYGGKCVPDSNNQHYPPKNLLQQKLFLSRSCLFWVSYKFSNI